MKTEPKLQLLTQRDVLVIWLVMYTFKMTLYFILAPILYKSILVTRSECKCMTFGKKLRIFKWHDRGLFKCSSLATIAFSVYVYNPRSCITSVANNDTFFPDWYRLLQWFDTTIKTCLLYEINVAVLSCPRNENGAWATIVLYYLLRWKFYLYDL